jgi:hypothetical protein
MIVWQDNSPGDASWIYPLYLVFMGPRSGVVRH